MKCAYNDGLKVDYSGSLRITKGDDVNVYIKEGLLPANIKADFDRAAANSNCYEMKKAALEVTATVGDKACIHE
jgi:hypothetical protein